MSLRPTAALALLVTLALCAAPMIAAEAKAKKPSLSLRANPNVGFSPLRVVFTAELRGGPNDYEEYYCPSIEWQWGDETESQDLQDCDPYAAGKYTLYFRLKRGDKVLTAANAIVRIRPGVRDIGE
jgi:hypothetical protein